MTNTQTPARLYTNTHSGWEDLNIKSHYGYVIFSQKLRASNTKKIKEELNCDEELNRDEELYWKKLNLSLQAAAAQQEGDCFLSDTLNAGNNEKRPRIRWKPEVKEKKKQQQQTNPDSFRLEFGYSSQRTRLGSTVLCFAQINFHQVAPDVLVWDYCSLFFQLCNIQMSRYVSLFFTLFGRNQVP